MDTSNLSGTLSDETLNALADDAWQSAGLPGDPATVDTGNGDGVASGSITVVDQGLDDAAALAGFLLNFGATGGLTLPKSANAIRNGTSHALDPALSPTEGAVYALTGTYDCPGGGTVGVTGSIVLTVEQTLAVDDSVTSGMINTRIQDLLIRFSACTDGGLERRLWGTVLISTDNTVSAAQQIADPDLYDIALDVDESVQAGLAFEDLLTPDTYYRLVLRYTRTGYIDAVRDTSLNPNDPGELTLDGTLSSVAAVNGVTCTTTVDFVPPDTQDVTKGCAVP